jgi:hypothetical protein
LTRTALEAVTQRTFGSESIPKAGFDQVDPHGRVSAMIAIEDSSYSEDGTILLHDTPQASTLHSELPCFMVH